ncbi:50S ribosomal protein P1 [Candidatus Micrarchaeota archaeon]|nr:50S ribosomal protein P1 [Candidatus Micrarchaeota archaeon]
MEYIYGALLLHYAKQPVNEESMKKVLSSAGIAVDENKVKALISALEGVNINEALKQAAIAPVAAPAPGEKKEEKKEEVSEEKKEEAAAEGLSALFG